jgi:hypothetical protein
MPPPDLVHNELEFEVESCRIYYMGEGDGFLRVRAVVSLVSLELPVVCPSTKGVPESELTTLWWLNANSNE